MIYDGVALLESSSITNATIQSGTVFPAVPTQAELFYRTDLLGLYVYNGTAWDTVSADVQPLDDDLISIASLSGTTGLLRKVAANTWALDTNTYLTSNEAITLSGDVSGSGTSAITATLATVNSNVGSFGSNTLVPVITVNGKGLVTAVSTASIATSFSINGDVSGIIDGGTDTLTLATVNTNVGSFGGASSVPSFTVNAKGLITAASTTAVVAPAGTLSGTTLNATVVSSSLTSVGTLASLAVTGAITGASFNSITGLSSTTPIINGTAAIGVGTTAARADHVHPTDTTRLAVAAFTDAAVTGKVLTGYASATGTIAATDTILSAIQKLDGNLAANASGTVTSVSGTGTVSGLTLTGTVTTSGSLTLGGTIANLPNTALTNSSVTVGTTNIALGNTSTTLAGLTSVTSTTFVGALTGNASTATILATARDFSITGDVTATAISFNGSGAVALSSALASVGTSGVKGSASSVPVFTTDAKGRVTANTDTAIAIAASQTTSGTFADARIAASNVTQHQASLTITESQITDGTLLARVGGNETVTGTWSFNNAVTVGTPSATGHATTKAYVDAAIAGLSWKQSARAATTSAGGNITLSGTQTIDGIALVAGNRVLVKNQTTTSQNGIYLVAAGAWTRAEDFDSVSPIDEINSAAVFVQQGTTQADTSWTQTATVVTVGTDSMSFTQFSGTNTIVAGAGLLQSGQTFDVVGTAGRIVANADSIDLATAGTAGTYRSVTTDAYGRVTAGTNPTTLAGYGITDAQALDADLTAIGALAGTSGLLRKTAANTWSLDTATYLTGITSGQVTTALGFTPYDAANPAGYTTNTGTVNSVSLTAPVGLTVGGSPVTTSGTLALTFTAGYSIPTTASQTNWDTAFTDRNKWDGGATGLVAATGRTSLGATTAGSSLFTLTNPSAITFLRINADNTATALSAADFRTAIGAGTGGGSVSTVSVVSANGFAGTVATAASTPAITLSTSITGVLKGNGTALSAATAGTDYSIGTSALTTGILKSTTATGALSIAVAGDFPTLNQNTTGSAALNVLKTGDSMTGALSINVGGSTASATPGMVVANGTNYGLQLVARNAAGGWNGLAQVGDSALIASGGAQNTATGLVLGLWSNAASPAMPALRIDASGSTTFGGPVVAPSISYGTIGNVDDATLTTAATTANQVVATFPTATYRSAKFQIQATSGSAYHMTEINVIHDGTTVYLTEFGTVLTGASLASFDADISAGNVRLLVTPVNAVTTIKVIRTAVTV